MLILILLSSLSFLILVTMISLRWFNYSFVDGSLYHKVFKKGDNFLDKQFSILKKSSKKYKNILSLLVLVKRFLFFQVIKLYNLFISFLRKINNRIGKLLKKASLKKGEETVSEYLRNVSDYKDQE